MCYRISIQFYRVRKIIFINTEDEQHFLHWMNILEIDKNQCFTKILLSYRKEMMNIGFFSRSQHTDIVIERGSIVRVFQKEHENDFIHLS